MEIIRKQTISVDYIRLQQQHLKAKPTSLKVLLSREAGLNGETKNYIFN